MKFSIIVAIDKNRGIGINGKLPWHLPLDLKYFTKITTETKKPDSWNAVIMGRTTWESLSSKFRPLPNRFNIVLTHQINYNLNPGWFYQQQESNTDVVISLSLDHALKIAHERGAERAFVIGGGKVFTEAVNHPGLESIYVTEIQTTFNCDTFFPEIDLSRFARIEHSKILEQDTIRFQFVEYRKNLYL